MQSNLTNIVLNGLKASAKIVCCFVSFFFFRCVQVPQKDVKENPEVIGEIQGYRLGTR